MANPEHLEILKQGVEVWNRWREENSIVIPNLRGADLSQFNLSRANLNQAFLLNADLQRTDLRRTNLSQAVLTGANLRKASLISADLSRANLSQSCLIGANLKLANFNRADLRGTDLKKARLFETVFTDTDLSGANGLDECNHLGPSTIDHRTLARTEDLPVEFLQKCKLHNLIIENVSVFKGNALQYYSCFISYSSTNEDFAKRIHADLQDSGVRCWFAPEDMKIGDKIRHAIDSAIRLRDKLLVILSETSVNSQWVETEVETAMEEERERGEPVLFPVRIDDAVMETKAPWARMLRRERHIGDFTGWKNHDSYQKAFERLLRDLKA